MSWFDYKQSEILSAQGWGFYQLLFAAIREADSDNLSKIRQAWPEVYQEFIDRYNAPGGLLLTERAEPVN